MCLILILAIGFYLYKTGDLQRMINKNYQTNEAKKILDIRLAKGEITEEEYNKLKSIL
ncbi:SHOCT domain-containing protein [Thermoanaerobacter italicus]|uniref:SHOCT domain-containing protein n=1 Tax=Thermoanaerobacter italicus TaxID=108150 RepID=UPI001B7FC712|nr:SHOCT domain-containing protein [Thermoanaerobacter italicus]